MSENERIVALARMGTYVDQLCIICHIEAKQWWVDPKTGEDLRNQTNIVPTKLLLIVSEICEAMEGHRKDLADDHLPGFEMIEVELADALIRIFDLAGAKGYRLGAALAAKVQYNSVREDHKLATRLAEGGKSY